MYAVDASPRQPGTVAIGVGDNMARVWEMGPEVGDNLYAVSSYYKGIHGKVWTRLSIFLFKKRKEKKRNKEK